ncbi:hypothetical protein NPIL_244591 [Nephila pilipes]|uniref:Uncharacterized protein n=1 Tax=Nephila pilipes TaxID=299642 RepID=A0A8X6NJX6_NEPPI|nr:hypothetical protein NPIL_244591 [Nephila pilipes]
MIKVKGGEGIQLVKFRGTRWARSELSYGNVSDWSEAEFIPGDLEAVSTDEGDSDVEIEDVGEGKSSEATSSYSLIEQNSGDGGGLNQSEGIKGIGLPRV